MRCLLVSLTSSARSPRDEGRAPVNAAYRTLIESLPEGALVPVPREQLLALLGGGSSRGEGVLEEVGARVADYSTREVAKQFGKAASTVRAWCERGRLPGAYLRAGKEWRIPAAAIHAMQRAESQADRERRGARAASVSQEPAPNTLVLGAWRRVKPGRAGGASSTPRASG